MFALIVYLSIALGFSFLCSIAEAVLLSITTAYISVMQQEGRPAAKLLQKLKQDVDEPLSAILSLNTIAHTVGAAGVGAQAAKVFGSQYLGLTSGVLTLLILIFSEIIPKTLGSHYWRQLAPSVAYLLKYLIVAMYPLVWLSKRMTRSFAAHPTLDGFSREEFAAMASLGEKEGQLAEPEAKILRNLFQLSELNVMDVLTPAPVVFRLQEDSTIEAYLANHRNSRFSRVPIYSVNPDTITGFVLRSDLLVASAKGELNSPLKNYRREMVAVVDKLSLLSSFETFIAKNAHIMYVVDEYGSLRGIITLEDIFETLVGMEIVDETDHAQDMRKFARERWRKRMLSMGIDVDNLTGEHIVINSSANKSDKT